MSNDNDDDRGGWVFGDQATGGYVEFDATYQCGRSLCTRARRVKLSELASRMHIADMLVVLFLMSHSRSSWDVPADELLLRIIEDALRLEPGSTSSLRYRVPFGGSHAFGGQCSHRPKPEAPS